MEVGIHMHNPLLISLSKSNSPTSIANTANTVNALYMFFILFILFSLVDNYRATESRGALQLES